MRLFAVVLSFEKLFDLFGFSLTQARYMLFHTSTAVDYAPLRDPAAVDGRKKLSPHMLEKLVV